MPDAKLTVKEGISLLEQNLGRSLIKINPSQTSAHLLVVYLTKQNLASENW